MSGLLARIHPSLGRSPLLGELSIRQAEVVSRMARVADVPPGTTLARQGQQSDRKVLIVEGEAAVERDGVTLGRLGPGDFFHLSGAATLVAGTHCVLLVATVEAFQSLAHVIPCLQERAARSEAARNWKRSDPETSSKSPAGSLPG